MGDNSIFSVFSNIWSSVRLKIPPQFQASWWQRLFTLDMAGPGYGQLKKWLLFLLPFHRCAPCRAHQTMKRDGNLCLVDVNLANWQHFTKCIINYVLNTCVIVYLLQYLVSVIIISETMKTIQHHEVDSEYLWHPLYHLLFHYGTI